MGAEQLWADVKLCEVSLISEWLSGSVHNSLRGPHLQSDTEATVKVLTEHISTDMTLKH